ncbi:MAG TPA: HAMP domain-containing sensor histidine kinase [Burkholderiales bacterium]
MLSSLSIRHKVLLRCVVLTFAVAAAVSGGLTVRAYDDLKRDVIAAAEKLGRVMALGLVSELSHDDVWRAYELISAPGRADRPASHPALIVVLDAQRKVYVSSLPERFPMQSDALQLGADFVALRQRLDGAPQAAPFAVEPPASEHFYMVVPVLSDGIELGTLVLGYPRGILRARFTDFAWRAAWITLGIAALLVVPIGYWAGRISTPLVELAAHMGRIGKALPDPATVQLYEGKDEIGQLGRAFRRMLRQLKEKERLEQQVVASERLAALGRLSAGIAHEINNPLGGMLNAIDTLKRHGRTDAMTARTLSLLERGLAHVRETVAALLVEAKLAPHPLAREDVEDVMTLAHAEANRKSARLAWRNALPERVELPATQVRQILLNLLLNAVQAVRERGSVYCEVSASADGVLVRVVNDGAHIADDDLPYVFEPFVSGKEGGHGLGLWVTYQVVRQLGGTIRVTSRPGETVFSVGLPFEPATEAALAA